jgi:BirA family transcriptional regulator, biotin operon repressor / biotin---[acetyl-CoA-carboxylase] ligase
MHQPSPFVDDLVAFLQRVTLPPRWRVLHEPSVSSTNDLAREAARRGWPDRSIFVADYQTEGRGRHGRSWTAPPRSGLLMSVLLRGGDAPPQAYTTLASVALCEAIERLTALEPAVKWPNDVMLSDRKVAGILAEATDGAERTVVIGIGANVSLDEETLADLPNATSLSAETGWLVHRGDLLALIVEQLDTWLKQPGPRLARALRPAWEQRLWRRRQTVRVREVDEEIEGIVLGADADGALRLELADGSERRVIAGEILP